MMMSLRKATDEDRDILFEWVNDKDTRRSAFDSHIITWEEHRTWFDHMMNDPDQCQYIFMCDDNPIGQVRLSIEETSAFVDYSIAPSSRGCGFGNSIIQMLESSIKTDFPNVRKIIARVKNGNIASYSCFIKNGFEETYRQLEYNIDETTP